VDTRERNKLARRHLRYGQDSYELEQLRQKYTKNEVIDQWDLFWNEETKTWFHSYWDRNGKRNAYDTGVGDPLDPWRAAIAADPVSSEADFLRTSGQVGAMLENRRMGNYENPFASSEEEIGEKDVKIDTDSVIRESVRRLILEEISVEKPLSYVDKLVEMGGIIRIYGDEYGFEVRVNSETDKSLAMVQTVVSVDKSPYFTIDKYGEEQYFSSGRVFDGHVVEYAYAWKEGWGILAYEVALELCSLYSYGLAPDRFEVSKDAYSVWEKYLQRTDVHTKQLDPAEFPLTKDTKDDGSFFSSFTAYEGWGVPEKIIGDEIVYDLKDKSPEELMKTPAVKNWFSNSDPLSKLYYKLDYPVLKELIMNDNPDGWPVLSTDGSIDLSERLGL